ncbi:MAG: hypothetical protein Q4P28_05720 [Tissierellia bacterium]|nr:hypothetical protein [Tissierellia bacterium]
MFYHLWNLFFIYAFIGYCWEVLWVSANEGHLVNRGFLHGPILPIYGIGMVSILIFTFPFRHQIIPLFFAGMAAATLLELVTGIFMEKVFGVKLWDYHNRPYNYKGYICLRSSIFWGIMSTIFVHWINVGMDEFLREHRSPYSDWITIFAIGVFLIDVSVSIAEAIHLKQLLEVKDQWEDYGKEIQKKIDEKYRPRIRKALNEIKEVDIRKDLKSLRDDRRVYLEQVITNLSEERRQREKNLYQAMLKKVEENTDLSRDLLQKLTHSRYERQLARIDRRERFAKRLIRRNKISYKK